MAAPESQFTRPVRILFADGNDDLRDYVKRQMGGFYEVDLASDGEAALMTARANPPDLLLADVMAPRLGGFGLLKEWRADPRLRHIPVILLSARAGEESRIEALTAGATDYLVKPFNARELLARVSICLEIARENRTSLEREQGLRISAEKSEARAREELAAEVTATNRLHELSTRPLMKTEFQPLLEEVLAATVALQNADFGCVQLYNPVTRSLQIVVQQGFKPDFLEYFRDCHDETTFCGRAILQGKKVIVKDILVDEGFAPHRPVALAAGYRAVQSTPIFSAAASHWGWSQPTFNSLTGQRSASCVSPISTPTWPLRSWSGSGPKRRCVRAKPDSAPWCKACLPQSTPAMQRVTSLSSMKRRRPYGDGGLSSKASDGADR